MNVNDTEQLVILQCKRVIEIIEHRVDPRPYYGTEVAELKAKMHELRRDTIRLENQLYHRI